MCENYNNVEVIRPESEVSSYELIKNSNKIVEFGSSIGYEANFLRKPVLTLGGVDHYNLNVSYTVKSKEEIIKLLLEELTPKEIIGSLKMANFLSSPKRGKSGSYMSFKYNVLKFLNYSIRYNDNYNYLPILQIINKIIDLRRIMINKIIKRNCE